MIEGCKFFADRDFFFIQTNDPVEELYKKLIIQLKKQYPEIHWGYLESCGVNSMANCFGVTEKGRELIRLFEKTLGIYKQQITHLMIGYLNDPINYGRFKLARSNLDPAVIQGNRVPQYYPLLAEDFFNIKAELKYNFNIQEITEHLRQGYPIQACLKTPSHYITIKAVDTAGGYFLFADSWPRQENNFDGFICRLPFSEVSKNVNPFYIVYYLK